MITRWRIGLVTAAAVALTAACGGDDGTGPSNTPAAIQSIAGNAQVGTVGQPLTTPIRVRVTNLSGAGVSGVSVVFDVVSGGGSVAAAVVDGTLASGTEAALVPQTVSTNMNGEAQVTWTLGPTVGEQVASASVAGLAQVTFTATAQAGAPASLVAVSGGGQEGPTGGQFPAPLVVRVQDSFGNGVSGATVDWAVTTGGGEFSAAQSQTDASGNASTLFTPRAPGLLVVTAAAGGAVPATFDGRANGTGTLDFLQAAALVDSRSALFGQEAIQSLIALTPAIDDAVGASTLFPVTDTETNTLRDLIRAFRSKVIELQTSSTSPSALATIPAGLLGKTLVWDAPTTSYVVDDARTGAPANGVRFILYEIDAASGLPVEPLVEIGHVDIVDTGTPPTVALSVTVSAGGSTVLSFDINGTFTATNLDLTIVGSVTDGVTSFDFSFDFAATPSDADLTFTFEAGGFVIGYEQFALVTGPGFLEFTLADAAGTDLLEALINFDAFGAVEPDSDVKFNGTVVAFFTGTLSSVTLTNIEGNPFTLAELEALIDYIAAVDRLAGVYIDLLQLVFIFL